MFSYADKSAVRIKMTCVNDSENEFEEQGVTFKIITEDMYQQVYNLWANKIFSVLKGNFRLLILCGYTFILTSQFPGIFYYKKKDDKHYD